MYWRLSLYRWSELLFRAGLAAVFGYFGILALVFGEATAARFFDPRLHDVVKSFMPISIVMMAFGVAQLAVAAGILFRILFKASLVVAALMLVGIIVNLGVLAPGQQLAINETALRDFVILTAIIYLLIHG
jgi:hypothetical protein